MRGKVRTTTITAMMVNVNYRNNDALTDTVHVVQTQECPRCNFLYLVVMDTELHQGRRQVLGDGGQLVMGKV